MGRELLERPGGGCRFVRSGGTHEEGGYCVEECALQGLPEGCLEEQELAEIFLLLLEWAVPEGNDRRTPRTAGGERRVRLRGTAVKKWVIMECASNIYGSDKMGDTERGSAAWNEKVSEKVRGEYKDCRGGDGRENDFAFVSLEKYGILNPNGRKEKQTRKERCFYATERISLGAQEFRIYQK